jgi:hypothetical protein
MTRTATRAPGSVQLVGLLLAVMAAPSSVAARPAQAATTSDAIIYVGQEGATSYRQSLDAVLYTENQIGFMADRILVTEGEIADMSDRIVYVSETSQNNTVEVAYVVSNVVLTCVQEADYVYEVTLTAVMTLPAGS